MKFTFKRQPRITGLAGVGRTRQDVDIKLNKRVVGCIAAPTWMTGDACWRLRFAVKDGDKFRWIELAKTTETEQEMRNWLSKSDVVDNITARYDLYSFDD